MSILVLNLHGPMQSWGRETYKEHRPSNSYPTRSGIIGLLSACLGYPRYETEKIAELDKNINTMAVRVDDEGSFMEDYHIVQGYQLADLSTKSGHSKKNTSITKREYLCGAKFTAALLLNQSSLIEKLPFYLSHPIFTPYLGRKCCPLTSPLYMDIVNCGTVNDYFNQSSESGKLIFSELEPTSRDFTTHKIRDIRVLPNRQFVFRTVYSYFVE